MSDYASTHGGWSSIYEISVDSSNHSHVEYKGMETPSTISFVQENFNASQIGTSDFMSVLSDPGHYIFTDLYEGNGTSHAVVVYSFDPATDKYRYTDDNGFQQEATADQLNTSVSMDVWGIK